MSALKIHIHATHILSGETSMAIAKRQIELGCHDARRGRLRLEGHGGSLTERLLFDVDVAWKVCAYSAAESFISVTGTGTDTRMHASRDAVSSSVPSRNATASVDSAA